MHNLLWAILILFLFATLFAMDWAYYLVYVMGGVWLLSHWSVRRILPNLQIERSAPERAFAGQKVEAKVTIHNDSWWPAPWLALEERTPLELRDATDYRVIMSVGGHDTTEHRYSFDCKQRGYYALGPLSVSTGDLFGFAQAEWRESATPHLLVYPRVLPLHKLGLPSRLPFGQQRTPRNTLDDPARMSGVRQYASGDSLRRVHWKASAHADTLLVKKFQPAIALNVVIALDLSRAAYPLREIYGASEWGVTVAASLASYATQERHAVGLLCNGLDSINMQPSASLPPRQGQGHLMTLLARLASVQLSDAPADLSQWLMRPLSELGFGATLLIVTPRLEESALWMLHGVHRRGVEVIVLVTAQVDLKPVQFQARRLGLQVHQVIWEKELRQL